MDLEFQNYEEQFEKFLNKIGITHEIWDLSQRAYIQTEGYNGLDEGETQNIKSIEKKSYEYLPTYTLGKTMTKEKIKSVLIDANKRA